MLGQASMNMTGQQHVTKAPELQPGAFSAASQPDFFDFSPESLVMPMQQEAAGDTSTQAQTIGLDGVRQVLFETPAEAAKPFGLAFGESVVRGGNGPKKLFDGNEYHRKKDISTHTKYLNGLRGGNELRHSDIPNSPTSVTNETSSATKAAQDYNQAIESRLSQTRLKLIAEIKRKPVLAGTGAEASVGLHTNEQNFNKGIGNLQLVEKSYTFIKNAFRRSKVSEAALAANRASKKAQRAGMEGGGHENRTDMAAQLEFAKRENPTERDAGEGNN